MAKRVAQEMTLLDISNVLPKSRLQLPQVKSAMINVFVGHRQAIVLNAQRRTRKWFV